MGVDNPEYEKLISDGNLTPEEHKHVMAFFKGDENAGVELKEIKTETKNELSKFIESDYATKSLGNVGEKGIIAVNNYFGIKNNSYSIETFKKIIKLQKTNGLEVNGIISVEVLDFINKPSIKEKKIGIDISKAKNIKDVLDITISSIMNEMLGDIESEGGISFSLDKIYVELLSVVDKLGEELPENHMFRDDIHTLKNNFLLPPKKGKEIIEASINLLTKTPEEDIKKQLDSGFLLLKTSLGAVFDISKNKSETDIHNYIKEFKCIPIIAQLLDTIPNFDTFFIKELPKLVNSIDKDNFLLSLDKFYNGTKNDFVSLFEYKYSKREITIKEKNKITLNIANNFGVLIGNITNQKTSEKILSILSNMDFIKNDSFYISIIDLINSPKIKNSDKERFTKKIINIFCLATTENITDEEFQNNITIFLEELLRIGTKFDSEKLKVLLKEIEKKIPKKEDKEKKNFLTRIKEKLNLIIKSTRAIKENIDTLVDVIKDNKVEISELFKKWIKDGVEKSDIVEYLVTKGFFRGKAEKMVKIFIKEVKNILDIDIKDLLISLRKSYLNSSVRLEKFKYSEKIGIKDEKSGIIGKITDKLISSGSNMLEEKLSNTKNNFISKKEVINLLISDLKQVLSQNKDLLIKFLKENGLEIKNKQDEKLIIYLVDSILKNPKLPGLLSKIMSLFINGKSGKISIGGDIGKLIKESYGLLANDSEVVNDLGDIGVDILYDNILSSKENIANLLSIIKENIGINFVLDEDKIPEIALILKKYIKPEVIKKIISNNPEIIKGTLPSGKIIKIISEIYSQIDKKTDFLSELINTGIVKELKSNDNLKDQGENKNFEKLINKEKLNNAIFDTLEETDGKKVGNLINKLIKDFGMGELLNIKICQKSFGENSVILLKAIGRNNFEKLLINNSDLIKNVGSLELNNNKDVLYLVSLGQQIASKIDIKVISKELTAGTQEEKLWLESLPGMKNTINFNSKAISRLAKSGLDIYKMEEPTKLKIGAITPENILDINSIIFDFIRYSGSEKVSGLVRIYLEKLGFGEILKLNIFGQDFSTNSVLFLKSIGEKKFGQILVNNLDLFKEINKVGNLNKIIEEGTISKENKELLLQLSKVGREVITSMNIDKFKKGLNKTKLTDTEKLGLELGDKLHEILKKGDKKLDDLISKGADLFKIYKNKVSIEKGSTEAEHIQKYGEDLFDFINQIVSSFDKGYIENYFASSEVKTLIKEKTGSGDTPMNPALKNFITNFIINNMLFTIKTGLKSVFDGFKIDKGGMLDDYFRNKGNRHDFGETVHDCFIDNNKVGKKRKKREFKSEK